MWKWESEGTAEASVVIIHGAGEYHARYKWLIKQFQQMKFQVFIGDLPGQGTTSGPRGHVDSFQVYIQKVRKWLEEAKKEGLPVILVAHSMGGLIGASVMQKLQEQEMPDMIIFSSPCFGLVDKQPWTKRSAVKMLNRFAPKTMFPNGLEPGSGTRSQEMRKRDEQDDLLVKHVSARWYSELIKAIRDAHEKAPEFPDIPCCVMQGGEDRIVDKAAVRRWFDALQINDKVFKEWPGLYHEVFNEPEREDVFTHIAGFITIRLLLSGQSA
ncbi:alpha/beta hydrolase [Alkalicoccus saliphilus]|uniref:Phospholipase n=1 Tax=Alkalicoccus saliphilus TaxID=200989 RepID=A0A2T4U8Q0_9BACI|nr:alpha/beta hydrolase [Alkalicoccus saliphilus]PTL39776.1 phospholipase [Alkalicoccus saliphilus]